MDKVKGARKYISFRVFKCLAAKAQGLGLWNLSRNYLRPISKAEANHIYIAYFRGRQRRQYKIVTFLLIIVIMLYFGSTSI